MSESLDRFTGRQINKGCAHTDIISLYMYIYTYAHKATNIQVHIQIQILVRPVRRNVLVQCTHIVPCLC